MCDPLLEFPLNSSRRGMALPFWCSLSLMTLPSEAPALPTQEKTYLPLALLECSRYSKWTVVWKDLSNLY